jgi:dihydropteroate synthase
MTTSKNRKRYLCGDLDGLSVGDNSPVRIMGVINLSPDSFYKDSVRGKREDILRLALEMQEEGASVIDLGARSTAPYKTIEVSEELETKLLSDAVKFLVDKIDIPLSIDSTRSKPARAALELGARILNDPYGLAHEEGRAIAELASDKKCSLILTAHEKIKEEIHDPIYRIRKAIRSSLEITKYEGVKMSRITIDPGIGFFFDSKLSNVQWNLVVLANLEAFRVFGRPILVGVSRKSFLGILGGDIPPELRLPGSLSATAIAVYNGAHIIRTHDVKQTLQTVKVASAIKLVKQKGLRRIGQVIFP